MFKVKRIALFTLLYLFICGFATAQEKSIVEQLKEALQKKYAHLSILVRNIGDFQIKRTEPGTNGFSIENFRVKLSGDLNDNFGYDIQTKFLNAPAILDARLYYKFSPLFRLDFGLYKAPFSREYLISEADIDFVFRSQFVSALALGKQVGISVSGETGNNLITYSFGMFNGNKGAGENDNNQFLYSGRVVFEHYLNNSGKNLLKAGINAAVSNDKSVTVMDKIFEGNRLLIGGDIDLTIGNFNLYSEALWGRLKWTDGHINKPSGYYVTAGYTLSDFTRIVARWDSFREDADLPSGNYIILGLNVIPAELFELQFNYAVSVNEPQPENNRLLLNAQFSF